MIIIKKNEPLSKHTTFKIGGSAKYFCIAKTIDDIKSALDFAKRNKLEIFILGAGSNVLFSDNGFSGLVISLKGASGILLPKLLNYCASKGLSGLEFLAGVPGTMGGAIYMNAGAYGKSIGDIVECVYAIDYNGKTYEFGSKSCKFSYRSSIFQKRKLIITGAEFNLKKGNATLIKKEMQSIIKKRMKKQPYNMPSAGSVFKNPKDNYAASLIEKAHLKGERIGDAMVSKKHANFIVNMGKAKAKDVKALISLIKKKVKFAYKINLETEVEILE